MGKKFFEAFKKRIPSLRVSMETGKAKGSIYELLVGEKAAKEQSGLGQTNLQNKISVALERLLCAWHRVLTLQRSDLTNPSCSSKGER